MPSSLLHTVRYYVETQKIALKIHIVRLTPAVTILPGAGHEKPISSLDWVLKKWNNTIPFIAAEHISA